MEWRELAEFAASEQVGASLGLVYGRRRQGKTLMLELLVRQAGGFLFGVTQQSEAQNLADLGAAYGAFRGLRRPVLFGHWREALEELSRIGEDAPVPVVIDEFPYLVAATPALPSYFQQCGCRKAHPSWSDRIAVFMSMRLSSSRRRCAPIVP